MDLTRQNQQPRRLKAQPPSFEYSEFSNVPCLGLCTWDDARLAVDIQVAPAPRRGSRARELGSRVRELGINHRTEVRKLCRILL